MDDPSFVPTTRLVEIGWCERLGSAWQSWPAGASPPRWQDYLPPSGETCNSERIFFLIQMDIEHRVKSALPALLMEPYFLHPRLSQEDARLDEAQQVELIRWEYRLRWEQGDRARSDDYRAAFPQHADALRDLRPHWTCPRCRRAAVVEKEAAEALTCPGCASTFPLSDIFRPRTPDATRTGSPRQATGLPSISGYEILEELSRGGMGVVYKARHLRLNRVVALKMILSGGHAGSEERLRFQAEAEVIARLQHPHIVQIHEFGHSDGLPFFAMEFCPGGTLARKLQGVPLPPAEAAALVETLARTVDAAHHAGVIHRDLKPANVLLDRDGRPKVADFGLAKRTDGAGQTGSGEVLGTPSYMAPEQAQGRVREVGPAVDLYALGAVLYECLTGRPPFKAATAVETLLQVVHEEPVPPTRLNAQVPRDLEVICLKCLHKEARSRYLSAGDLAEELRRYQAGEPIQARPAGRLERGVKWVKRRPATAALLGLGFLTMLALLVVIVGLFYNAQLRDSRDLAQRQEAEAQKQRRRAEELQQTANEQRNIAQQQKDLARRSRYLAQMNLAQRRWEEGEIPQVLELLQINQPGKGAVPTGGPDEEDLRGFEWHYLRRLSRHLLTLKGYKHYILDVAFSPDGTRLASACWDGTVRVHDARSGQEVLTLKAWTQMVYCVAFSPDGKRLAAGAGNQVQVWDASTGRELLKPMRDSGQVYSVAFSSDGTHLASAGQSNKVLIRDAVTGKELREINSPSGASYRVVFSADGKSLVAVGQGWVTVWDAGSGELRFGPDRPRKAVGGRGVGADGLSLGSEDGKLKVWNAATGEPVQTLQGHAGSFNRVAFSPAGKRVASGGEDLAIKVWDLGTGQELLTLRGHTPQRTRVYLAPSQLGITALALSPDGRRLASAANDQTVMVWDATSTQETLVLQGFKEPIARVSFSADGRRLAAVGNTAGVRIFQAATGEEIARLDRRRVGENVLAAELSPDGQRLATACADSDTVRVWDVATGGQVLALQGHEGGVRSLTFSPDGHRLVVGGKGAVKVWDAAGNLLLTFDKHTKKRLARFPDLNVAWSPDGKRILSASNDPDNRGNYILDAGTGREIRELSGHGWGVASVAFSPDGQFVATAGGDNIVILWNAATGAQHLIFRGHTQEPAGVNCVAISPDGRLVVSGGDDQCVRVWDAATGQEVLTLKGHKGPVRSVTFSPDGRRIFSLGNDGVLRVWDGRPVDWTNK